MFLPFLKAFGRETPVLELLENPPAPNAKLVTREKHSRKDQEGIRSVSIAWQLGHPAEDHREYQHGQKRHDKSLGHVKLQDFLAGTLNFINKYSTLCIVLRRKRDGINPAVYSTS